jgi:hypothetical protein
MRIITSSMCRIVHILTFHQFANRDAAHEDSQNIGSGCCRLTAQAHQEEGRLTASLLERSSPPTRSLPPLMAKHNFVESNRSACKASEDLHVIIYIKANVVVSLEFCPLPYEDSDSDVSLRSAQFLLHSFIFARGHA